LTPTEALVSNAADYYLTFDEAKIQDVAGVTAALGTGIVTKTYTVKDLLAPVLTVSHTGDVQNTVANANPKITFADDNLGTLTNLGGTALTALSAAQLKDMITFKEGSASGPNLPFAAAYAAGVITITPGTALATDKTYYYGIGASVKDAAGNAAPEKFSTFKMIAPVNPPAIVATTYTVNGSAQTPVATKLIKVTPTTTTNKVLVTVSFNDNVKEVATSATVDLKDGATVISTATVTAANVSGNTLTLEFAITGSLPALFDAGKELAVVLPATLVQGSTAYSTTAVPPFAQFAGTTILFDSKDILDPVVTSAVTYDATTPTPAVSTTAVALNTKLELVIGEKVVLGSGDILIKDGTTLVQTIPVNATNVTLNAAGTLATVVKSDLVKFNTVYTVEVPVGAFKDDVSLNSNTAATFTFTTLPNAQPTATFTPADDSDLLSTSGTLTLGMAFSEEVVKFVADPLNPVGTRKQWFLIKDTGTTTTPGTRASFNASWDLVAGTDVVVANNYIETSSVGISGANVTIATGYVPVAGEKYYVLITPGSFLDKATGASLDSPVGGAVEYPVPGVYPGVTLPTAWNFTTKDEIPGTVTFEYTKRADDKVAITSDITIKFSRPIKNGDGSPITSSQIATLFTLTKTSGSGPGPKAFIGTISADKKTVTVLNSSLVTLGELTELSTYTIATNGTVIYANGTTISGATSTFTTSDYTAPVATPTIATPVSDIDYVSLTAGAPKQHVATVTFTCTDNANLSALYYTIQEGDATTLAPPAAVVKADKTVALTGTAPAATTYQFTGLKEETSYVVWAVAVDKAGNESVVNGVVFSTDDVTKPTMATLPTSFDADKKLTFIFNEAVSPVNGSVRILNAATMEQVAVLDLLADPATTPNPKLLITNAWAGLATTDAVVEYYVEIDKGLVADKPVVATDAVNTYDGLFRTALKVTSKDATNPAAPAVSFIKSATDPSKYSVKLVFNEPVKKAATLPISAAAVSLTAGSVPFEVVDPANIVTDGTATVMINIARSHASATSYDFALAAGALTDMSGNPAPGATGTYSTTDFVAPTVVFVPAKGATAIAAGAATLTMTFNEAIRNLDDSDIDSYDLDSLVYVKKGNTNMAFVASLNPAKTVITINPVAALVTDATYTFGFKAKFEDASNNKVPADAATFNTVTTASAAYLT